MRILPKKIVQYVSEKNRFSVFVLGFLLVFSLATYALASFYPGETNDPGCHPGDAGCFVAVIPAQGGHAGEFLTTDGTTSTWVTGLGGITTLNGLSGSVQTFAVGTSGTDFAVSSSGTIHTFNLPSASHTNRGALTSADWDTFNNKLTSSLADAKIFVGNSGGTATAQTLTGDAALSNTGVLTIGSNAITTTKINNAAVTYAKLQNEGALSLLGNPTGSPAAPSEITLGAGLSFSGTTLTATGSAGTVTTFSAGTLSPLFTTSVSNPTSTPALSFSLSNAGAHTFFGNFTGSSAAPSYGSPSLASADFANQGTTTQLLHGNASGNPSWGQIVNGDITNGTIDLTAKVTGILPVANGGTGVATGYTFSTGLTNSSGTITNNLLTGLSGGQTIIGGTGSAENLILSSTSNSTKGYVGITSAPRATANYGSLSIGSGAWDGATSGFFVGSSLGTSLAINEASGYVGSLGDFQVGGISKFKINATGSLNQIVLTSSDWANNTLTGTSGFNGYVNYSGGIGTGGTSRLNSVGNLLNIGSIQGGSLNLSSGGTFAAKADKTTGTSPLGVATADLNGDGYPDMAVVNSGGPSISVFINNGSGGFAAKVDYTTGSSPTGIVAADLNGDGYPDLAVGNGGPNTVSVFINSGTGTFAAKVDYTTAAGPNRIAAGDFNGDGKTDLVTSNSGGSNASVLMNNGNGTFATKVDYAAGTNPAAVAAADLNGDGKTDFVVVSQSSTIVSAYINNGNGTFAAKVDYTTGTSPAAVAIGDVNNDGRPDLVTVNATATSVSVFINSSVTPGTFAAKVDYTVGTVPKGVAIADVNGDGKGDLIVANQNSNNASVLLNNGAGTFAAKVDYTTGTGPNTVAAADFNGDGKIDFAITNNAVGAGTSVSVFLNNASPLLYASAGSGIATGGVGIGNSAPAGLLDVSASLSGTPSGTIGKYLSIGASTFTDSTTGAGNNGPDMVFNSIGQGTLASTASSVNTINAYGLYLAGAPAKGTNDFLYNSSALTIASANVGALLQASYGLQVNAMTGAPNNYAAIFNGGNVGIGTSSPGASLEVVGNILSKGASWTSPTSAAADAWSAITYGNGMFVAVSTSGTIMTSPEGLNWTTRTSPSVRQWKSVTYGNGLFVAVANNGTTANQIMTSSDGITWTSQTSPSASTWNSITYGKGTFVAVNEDGSAATQVMTSPDGITWTSRTSIGANPWKSVTYGNGYFVAIASTNTGISNEVMASPDGITWTGGTLPFTIPWQTITYGNGLFVVVASSTGGSVEVVTASDPLGSWTFYSNPVQSWQSITYGNGLFVAVANNGTTAQQIMTSPDGATWTSRTSPNAQQWKSVAYGNGKFVAVAANGTTSNDVMTSGFADYATAQNNNQYNGGITITGLGTSNAADAVCIDASGVLFSASTSCTVPSALRFKTDVSDLTGNLDKVLALRPISYTSKLDGSHNVGFIAEEVAPIEDRLVDYDKDGQVMGLNYAQFAPLFAGAIKEIDTKIEPLVTNGGQGKSVAELIASGIGDFFAKRVHTTELCLSDNSGSETCVTKTQLDQFLNTTGTSSSNNNNGTTGSEVGTTNGGGGATSGTGGTTSDDSGTTADVLSGTTGSGGGTTADAGTTGEGTTGDTTPTGTTE